MAYRKTGYLELTSGEVILHYYDKIKDTKQDAILAGFKEVITAIYRMHSKVTTMTFADIAMMMAGTEPGSRNRSIVMLLAFLLKADGRLDLIPPMLTYRVDPSMALDELTGLMMEEALLPSPMGLPQVTTWEHILPFFMIYLQKVQNVQYLRKHYTIQLRKYCSHVMFQIKNRLPITQEEKTFFLHMSDDEYGATSLLQNGEEKSTRPSAMENGDPNVVKAFQLAMSKSLKGPKLNHMALISTQKPEGLTYYMGPHVTNFVSSAGYITQFGGFNRLDLIPVQTMPWGAGDQLIGVGQTSIKYVDRTGKAFLSSVSKISDDVRLRIIADYGGVTPAQQIPFIPDLEGANPEFYRKLGANDQVLESEEMITSYVSHFRGRPMLLNSPDEMILDTALRSAQTGGTQAEKLSIDAWNIADTSLLESVQLPANKRFGHTRIMENVDSAKIFYVDSDGKMQDRVVPIQFAMGYGDKMVRPAFAEFWRPHVAQLWNADEAVLSNIRMYLGLTDRLYNQSKVAMTLSYNYNRLKKVFGKVPDLGETDDDKRFTSLRDIAKKLTGAR